MNMFFFIFQPELPHTETGPGQRYGEFTIEEFLSENWYYILGLILVVFIYWLYRRQYKKALKKKTNFDKNI